MEPLADVLTGNFLRWLPKVTYPTRVGMHANSSFALSRAMPYARLRAARGQPELGAPSRTPLAAGTRMTPATRAAGSRPGTTSCHPRWPRPS